MCVHASPLIKHSTFLILAIYHMVNLIQFDWSSGHVDETNYRFCLVSLWWIWFSCLVLCMYIHFIWNPWEEPHTIAIQLMTPGSQMTTPTHVSFYVCALFPTHKKTSPFYDPDYYHLVHLIHLDWASGHVNDTNSTFYISLNVCTCFPTH